MFGLLVILAGLLLNALVILAVPSTGHQHHTGSGLTEHTAHLVAAVGMALTLAGVVIDGARRQLQRRRVPATSERSPSHAHR